MQWIAPTANDVDFVTSILKKLTCEGALAVADIEGRGIND